MFFTGPLWHHLNFGHGEHVDERFTPDGTRNVSSGAASFLVEPPGCTISRRCGKTEIKTLARPGSPSEEVLGSQIKPPSFWSTMYINIYVAVAAEDAHLGRVTNVHGSCVVEPAIP